jgi:uncharacterized iron-regulated protein
MMRTSVLIAVVGLLGTLASAETRAQTPCPSAAIWQTIGGAWPEKTSAHPLAGMVLKGTEPLSSSVGGACGPTPIEQLQGAIRTHLEGGGIVLLGEVHDNGAQHALRGALITAITADIAEAKKQRPPALVFEHIRADQAAALEAPRAPTPEGARDLLQRLDWEKSGWPSSKLFLPIFEAAVVHALPILSGHPTRAEVRDVARRGLDALPAETVPRLGLDAPPPEALQSALLDELEASHCGLMPRTAFGNMALAQRYRDAHMAAALAGAARAHGSAILLAGNGHVRTDRGVPWDLARMAPERKVLAVMLMEVSDGRADPTAYVERDPQGKPAADFTVLTPRAERPDPCETMRARFKKPG